MTAAVGHPCLRVIRYRVGPYTLGDLQPGEWREAEPPGMVRDEQLPVASGSEMVDRARHPPEHFPEFYEPGGELYARTRPGIIIVFAVLISLFVCRGVTLIVLHFDRVGEEPLLEG